MAAAATGLTRDLNNLSTCQPDGTKNARGQFSPTCVAGVRSAYALFFFLRLYIIITYIIYIYIYTYTVSVRIFRNVYARTRAHVI